MSKNKTRDSLLPITIVPGQEFNCRFGTYRHSDFLGIPYGSQVASRNGRGFVHLLRPTPELWTMALPHRTQILYLADISFVTAQLGLRPGMHVLEAGTGSGSFTHSVARTVGPTGRIYSFEFHETRAIKAREEFQRHGILDYVVLQHRNVCRDGFGLTDAVDAKQVQRTVSALNEHGFTDISMYETLLRPYDVNRAPTPVSVKSIRNKLQSAEQGKEERRLHQIATSKAAKRHPETDMNEPAEKGQASFPDSTSGSGNSSKRKHDLPELDNNTDPQVISGQDDRGSKRMKLGESSQDRGEAIVVDAQTPNDVEDTTKEPGASLEIPDLDTSTSTTSMSTNVLNTGISQKNKRSEEDTHHLASELILTQTTKEVRGHTSYLTFASLLPATL
ncbi:hypothetical protein Clacol_007584 [Clathrus columnatus]|uniref:tRNA (adenine(58)-N(1))-methyltransferase catalytic subunit TRM61 n=1 Tax=Clathrus columnatus TaxID=1419009 RepID=A0AAV5AI29_9AGAM|nr:hypothetical protein Clacol_007584 [Clathrus columnatus]